MTAARPLLTLVIAAGSREAQDLPIIPTLQPRDASVEVLVVPEPGEGLSRAAGEWVSFPDPDDTLDPGYLTELTRYLGSDQAAAADVVATHPKPADPAAAGHRHVFPERFTQGTAVKELAAEPGWLHLHRGTFVIRRADLAGLTFDAAPGDLGGAALLARALLRKESPTVAVLPEAVYRYRGSRGPWARPSIASPAEYDALFDGVHLALLDAAEAGGSLPVWLQLLVLYDLSAPFMLELQPKSPTAALSATDRERFLSGATRVLRRLDPAIVADFRLGAVRSDVRAAWLGLMDAVQLPETPRFRRVDREQNLGLVRFYHDNRVTRVDYLSDGGQVVPVFQKRRGVEFFGRALVSQAIAWLPVGPAYTIRVDDEVRELAAAKPAPKAARPRPVPRKSPRAYLGGLRRSVLQWVRRLPRDRAGLLAWWARPGLGGRKFADNWLLIDRDTEAHDNAEHLYRYLRRERPDINAWFVLNRSSGDWNRLAEEGFRLIDHGSTSHTIALLNCRQLVSSQIDSYVVNPPNVAALRERTNWRYHFLQHGVAHDDLTRWFNPKPIESLVVSTPDEFDSLAGDHNNSVFTAREVVLTGLPRHDELVRLARRTPDERRRTVVFMPTWRQGLVATVGKSNQRQLRAGFWESDFATCWFGLINSPVLAEAAARFGLEVVFMPHPNLAPALDHSVVEPHVRVAGYADANVQEVLADAAVVVTDYSSIAFDAAVIERPVVYFQFDRAAFFGGGSGRRPGYFDYHRDGFGPVCATIADAEREIIGLLESGSRPAAPYLDRIGRTFTRRDGHACERVVQAITDRSLPYDRWATGA